MTTATTQLTKQNGAALIIALVFLVAITLLGLTSIRSSTMELRMAVNEETRITALEQAQAMIDLVGSDDDNLPVTGVSGGTSVGCYKTDGYTPPSSITCSTSTLTLDTTEFDGSVYAEVVRLEPVVAPMPRGLGMSGDKFESALFGIVGGYDRSDEGLGAAEIEQGKLKPLPKARGINN